jgi:hypothetical protein
MLATAIGLKVPPGAGVKAVQAHLRRNAGPKQKTRPSGQGLYVLRGAVFPHQLPSRVIVTSEYGSMSF